MVEQKKLKAKEKKTVFRETTSRIAESKNKAITRSARKMAKNRLKKHLGK